MISALTKEARALFPIWAASAVVLAAAATAPNHATAPNQMLPLVAAAFTYGFGCIILGAQAIGHEYSAGTLPALLAQPAPRSRTLVIKLSVLAVALAVLTALALPTVFAAATAPGVRSRDASIVFFAAATAFCLTPYLTMVCRSALGGIVFSVAVPGVLFVLGDLVGLYLYGSHRAADIDRFKDELFGRGMLMLLGFGALAGWRRFTRLQVIDGHGAHLEIPRLLAPTNAGADRREHHAAAALVAKELRLQQMTFVVVALYAALGLAAPDLRDDAVVVYAVIVSLLVGALASAEERLFGVHEWQLLLPVPSRLQWRIKAGVALGLALVVAVAVPALLRVLHAVDPPASARPIAWGPLLIAVIVLTSGALWVSTVSASGVRALALSLPATMAAIVASRLPLMVVDWATRNGLIALHGVRLSYVQTMVLAGVLAVPIAGLFLRFGRTNHRSLERSGRVIAAQALWLLAALVAAGAILRLAA